MQIDLTLRYQCRADCVHFRFNRRGKLLTGVCLKKNKKIKKRSLQLPRSSRLHLFKHLFLYKQQRSWSFFSNVSNLKGTTLLLAWEAESKNLWHFSSVDDNPPTKRRSDYCCGFFIFFLIFFRLFQHFICLWDFCHPTHFHESEWHFIFGARCIKIFYLKKKKRKENWQRLVFSWKRVPVTLNPPLWEAFMNHLLLWQNHIFKLHIDS